MGGRLQVIALVVAVAVTPSVLSDNVLTVIADQCRNTVGEQAAADVLNIVHQLSACTRFEDLQRETRRAYTTGGVREAIKSVCRQKDELVRCSDQAFQTILRCLNEEEQQGLVILQGTVGPMMDFACERADEIVATMASEEEQQCLSRLGERADTCILKESRDAQETSDFLKSLGQECKELDKEMECLNNISGTCKDSDILRLLNDMKREVLDKAICSRNAQGGGAAAVLTSVDTLLEQLARLILAVTVINLQPWFRVG